MADQYASPEEELYAAVLRQSLHREILYKTLGYCFEERTLQDVEHEIASYREFGTALQSQYFMVQVLVRHGGLECIQYDAQGKVVTAADIAHLDEDEVDDLVETLSFKTTEIGRAFYNAHKPEDRIAELFDNEPQRVATYKELLRYCASSAHPYTDIAALLKDRDILRIYEDDGRYLDIQPSVFVDKLERAGAMEWTRADGWITTDAGKAAASAA